MTPESSDPLRISPEEVLRWTPEEADARLKELEARVPVHPGLADLPPAPVRQAVVLGDTHGDWRSSQVACRRFLEDPLNRCLVGLGDYVDRAPVDCGEGSVANACYLLGLAADFPSRVFLILGNHETSRTIPVLPHDLPEEIDQLWGPDSSRYDRLIALLERGPNAARSSSGVYLAHAGFPAGKLPADIRRAFAARTESVVADVMWRECAASRIYRGVSKPFTETDLSSFLSAFHGGVFLRGHDPDLAGRSVFHGRCLTLHTTRVYERFGGVLVARVPLDQRSDGTASIQVEHLETEGRRYREP